MSMSTADLLVAIQNVLAADQALTGWCREQFGKAHKVFLGVDDQHPPREEDYPVVVITGADQLRGESNRESHWIVSLGVGVVNAEVSTEGNRVSYPGMLQAEAMRECVEDALYRAKFAPMESGSDAVSESHHPLYVSFTFITVRKLRSTRQAMPG